MNLKYFSLLLAFVVLLGGCAKEGNPDGRQDVSGTIKLNGEPLKSTGFIFFEPLDGTGSDGGRIPITNGRFLLTGQDGIKPGKYRVRISAVATFDKSTDTYRTPDTPDWREYQVRLIPEEFNEKSSLEFEVVEGKKNVFDYDVVTDFQAESLHKSTKKTSSHPGEAEKGEK